MGEQGARGHAGVWGGGGGGKRVLTILTKQLILSVRWLDGCDLTEGGTDCTQVTESDRVNGRQLIWTGSRTGHWGWIAERILSREGSGEADRRIPGAHEAIRRP